MQARWAIWTIAVAALLFVFLDWETSTSVTAPCEQNDGYAHEHRETKQCATLRSTVFQGGEPLIYIVCEWLDIHNGAVTGVATVLLTVITGGLVILGRDQGKTTRAQLRAYISVRARVPLIEDGRTRCECIIKNTGATPAYRVRDSLAVWIGRYPPTYWNTPEDTDEADATAIGPSDELTGWDDVEISQDDFEAISTQTKAIYATNRIVYVDTFGREWVTEGKWYFTGEAIHDPGDRRMHIEEYKAT
jgi:hypothetical protein